MMDFFEVVSTRRSVRSFSGEPLTEEQIKTILRCGMQAPSAHNSRPWRLLTITDRERMQKIKPLCRWWKMLDSAALLIVICMDTAQCPEEPREFLVDSCCAATENMLLAAHALGLGATWLGVCKGKEYYSAFCECISLPAGFEVTGMIAVGVPAAIPGPTERWEEEKWIRETFKV